MKTNQSWKKPLVVLAALVSFQAVMAQEVAHGQVLSSQAIDIDGYVHEAPATDAELEKVKNELRNQKNAIVINKEKSKKYKELTKTTEKLADVTEEYIGDRDEATSEIEKYNKKIDCLMNKSTSKECEEFVRNRRREDAVSTQMAAPVGQELVVEAAPERRSAQKVKIMPYAGMTAINGQRENLESDLSIGVRGETNISDRVSVGMGIHYFSLKTTDFDSNDYYGSSWYNIYNDFYSAREIEYSNLSLDIYSKFYLINGDRFRPYLGGGLAYNRSNIKYADNRSFDPYRYGYSGYYNNQFGDEEVISSHLSGKLMAGSEILLGSSIGMNIELAYSKGLGSSFNTDNGMNPYRAPDQLRLNDLNDAIIDANILSLSLGMVIMF